MQRRMSRLQCSARRTRGKILSKEYLYHLSAWTSELLFVRIMFIAVRDIVQISAMEIDDTFSSRSGIMTGVAVDKVPKIRTTGGP